MNFFITFAKNRLHISNLYIKKYRVLHTPLLSYDPYYL